MLHFVRFPCTVDQPSPSHWFPFFGTVTAEICKQIRPAACHQSACAHLCCSCTASVSSLFCLTFFKKKNGLIIPCNLFLPCLGEASWNADAAVCSVRGAGGLENRSEVWQGEVRERRNERKAFDEMSQSVKGV